jgi:hypothetical protein
MAAASANRPKRWRSIAVDNNSYSALRDAGRDAFLLFTPTDL